MINKKIWETTENITGIKGYGTFSRVNDKSVGREKLYYEVVLFSQQGGLQQIMIF
jgi:hypothetical protein